MPSKSNYPERQSARMSEIKNVGYTWMAKYNQLIPLPFKGLSKLYKLKKTKNIEESCTPRCRMVDVYQLACQRQVDASLTTPVTYMAGTFTYTKLQKFYNTPL